MSKDIKDKKKVEDSQENFILKKIRYYQGSIKDYETYWNDKIAEGEKEESPETKSFAKRNAELNKAYEIVPVEKDDTTMCTDVTSGETEKVEDKKEEKEEKREGGEEKKKVKKEKKEKDDDDHDDDDDDNHDDDDDDDDDDDKKKSKKKDKDDD